jgi:gluconate 2-dehydrogenase gamma chain
MEPEYQVLLSRRSFLKSLGYALGAGVLVTTRLSWALDKAAQQTAVSYLHLRGLLASEWATIGAAVDTIFPPVLQSPAASEVGVLDYLSNGFGDKLPFWKRLVRGASPNKGFSRFLPYYHRLSLRLNASARSAFGKAFAELEVADRQTVMMAFADKSKVVTGAQVTGLAPVKEISDFALFEMLKRHSVEGYFSEPVHGGNKDYRGWESIRHVCNMNYPKEAKCPTKVI